MNTENSDMLLLLHTASRLLSSRLVGIFGRSPCVHGALPGHTHAGTGLGLLFQVKGNYITLQYTKTVSLLCATVV